MDRVAGLCLTCLLLCSSARLQDPPQWSSGCGTSRGLWALKLESVSDEEQQNCQDLEDFPTKLVLGPSVLLLSECHSSCLFVRVGVYLIDYLCLKESGDTSPARQDKVDHKECPKGDEVLPVL